ncbi:MAG: cysteine desulfurase [Pyrinomonadaceae bacterium]|nr:cysteine desulfurase [Pyrinomonadaceae bacterium]MCX7639581.1 cysteine desulfurase [Pyrinomonadaceae bacterium]MDW8303974.1 cysteine desulfurase [Acidobacteriota bacterium]
MKQAVSFFDVWKIRQDFPILSENVGGKPLVYFDNAASSQVPKVVIERISKYLSQEHANIHRGVHYLSQKATNSYEAARERVKRFINARDPSECIFVRGCTEAINLVAYSFGKAFIQEGDEILITQMEHHANLVPWQVVAEERKAKLKIIPMNENGELILEEYESLLSERTKIIAITHVSNALGTINPIKEMIKIAHKFNIPVCVDGAQAVPHLKVDVQDLDADFYAFSGHKVFAPTGIGVLYGKKEWLEKMPPYQTGGGMIRRVTFEKTKYAAIPEKFEAGTPPIMPAIGLGAAIDYLDSIDFNAACEYEKELLEYATKSLCEIEGVRIIGNAREKASVISFVIDGIHPHDIGTILDKYGIAIRAGHHCAQPVMDFYNVPATARVSLAFYNTKEEIDKLVEAVKKTIEIFS